MPTDIFFDDQSPTLQFVTEDRAVIIEKGTEIRLRLIGLRGESDDLVIYLFTINHSLVFNCNNKRRLFRCF